MRRATQWSARTAVSSAVSIHALREEGDPSPRFARGGARGFYPRPPRGGRPCPGLFKVKVADVSIHALREEGDLSDYRTSLSLKGISIHALREEGDASAQRAKGWSASFLSTPSARRATPVPSVPTAARLHFYPRPPRGGRPAGGVSPRPAARISIHALREEGDW